VSAKAIAYTAVVSLVVVVAYESYRARQGKR